MTYDDVQELAEARRVLAFVFHRSSSGLFSHRRSQRDAALSDVNYWTEKWRDHWKPSRPPAKDRIWMGERP